MLLRLMRTNALIAACAIKSAPSRVSPPPQKPSTNPYQSIYACVNKDKDVKRQSSSGGIFSLLADYFLSIGGYVSGAVFSDDKIVKHIVSDKISDVESMRKSKYVQSYVGDCYKKIKSLLDDNNPVLFCSTPCQVAGLKAYLNKDYNNLFTVDLLCSSINPPFLLEEYIKYVTNNNYKKINKIDFRHKDLGWSKFSLFIEWTDKNDVVKKFYDENYKNILFNGIFSRLYMKSSCEECIYSNPKRVSDLTIGDFWGIDNINKSLNDDMGISFVMHNTEKGKEVFDKIKDKMSVCESIDYKKGINTQWVINGKGYTKHPNNENFFKYVKNHYSPMELTKELLGIKQVKILTYDFSYNYGAQLQSYALCEKIKKLGFNPVVIRRDAVLNSNHPIIKFRDINIPLTELCYMQKEYDAHLFDCNRVITGGDVMFRNWYLLSYDVYLRGLADFVHGKKVIASYGSSFCIDSFIGEESCVEQCKQLFKRYDKLLVREQSGVEILKNIFDVEAKQVVDPALLLDADDYSKLIDRAKLPKVPDKYIAYCIYDSILNKEITLDNLRKKLNHNIIHICKDKKGNSRSVESWLNYIKNSDFVITDSFHCCIFALIFKKPFIAVKTRDVAAFERINFLLETYNIKSAKRNSLDDISEQDIKDTFDWEDISRRLKANIEMSEKELLEILLMEPKYKEKYVDEELEILRSSSELIYEKTKIKNIIKNYWKRKIFKTSYEKSFNKVHKVVRILGIKMKFRVY